MKLLIARFISDDRGQDLIEYALLASVAGAILAAGVGAFGSSLGDLFQNVKTNVHGLVSKHTQLPDS